MMTVKPWDMLNKDNYVSEEISDVRMSICMDCPSLIKLTKTCKECGCFMTMKTKLIKAECPLGKWGAEETSTGLSNEHNI